MSTATKAVFSCCIALLLIGLVYRVNAALDPARPNDMPENARFIPTGYDLDHNERKGSWVSCAPQEGRGDSFCRVTDPQGMVIFQGNFLPVRSAGSLPGSVALSLAQTKLGWVNGPSEGSPVPVISMTDGSMLVPRDDRDALIHRWNTNPAEWRKLQSSE